MSKKKLISTVKKILILGYTSKKTNLITFFKKKNFYVKANGQKPLTLKKARSFDVIISFGYNKILNKNLLDNLSRPPINLHISYLPFNKGAHPNFWSFIEKTPKGVSIHEISSGIDSGKIILRKKVTFNLKDDLTFADTYQKLILEVENLFKKNYKKIINKSYKYVRTNTKGSIHKKKDLPKDLISWNVRIKKYLKKLN